MKTTYITFIFLVLLFSNCSSWKNTMVKKGNHNDAIQNAIKDFVNTSRLYNADSVFRVDFTEINDMIFGVTIMDATNKLYPTKNNKVGSNLPDFPTNFLVLNSKLFYWYDSTKSINNDIILILSEYNQIDSINVDSIVCIPNLIIDDSKKAVDYYFCKNNLLKYKKVTTKIAMGWYRYPKLKCNCKN